MCAIHCWHVSPQTHAAPNHRDEVCCNCGSYRCVSIFRPEFKHGEFAPVSFPEGRREGFDTVQFRYLVCAGKAKSIDYVYVDGVQTGSGWASP